MKKHFKKLYEYNLWANKLFSESLLKNEFKNEKILVLLAHVSAAQLIWLSRVLKLDQKVPEVWEMGSLDETVDALKRGSQAWLNYLDGDLEFKSTIQYMDTRGNTHSTVLEDIITHVANHGTHHRGQIAMLLREENIAPPASDYIFFVREKENIK